jgi:multidrug resistance efflux pump
MQRAIVGRVVAGLLVVGAIVAGVWYFTRPAAAVEPGVLTATGTIEAVEVRVIPEVGGRIASLSVDVGDAVTADQILVRQDMALATAQRDQAQANLEAARASLALLEAGPADAQVRAAEAQLAQAESALAAAQANLSALAPAARPEEVAAARAALEQARATYATLSVQLTPDQVELARTALTSAQSVLEGAEQRRADLADDASTPASVLAQADAAIETARGGVTQAEQAYDAARDQARPFADQLETATLSATTADANLALAQAREAAVGSDERATPEARDAARLTREDAQTAALDARAYRQALLDDPAAQTLTAAWDEVQRAQQALLALAAPRFGAPTTTASLETVAAQYDAARAARDAAAANLDLIRAGARSQQLEAARAQVVAAEAQVAALDAQLARFTLRAPSAGVVIVRAAEPGEFVAPGATVLTIADLSRLRLVVFVPEDRFGQIRLGQGASLGVDSWPGQSFSGTVTAIADQAEFTPRNVQTAAGRRTMVFAVTLTLDNPDGLLKPGMPADVTFLVE